MAFLDMPVKLSVCDGQTGKKTFNQNLPDQTICVQIKALSGTITFFASPPCILVASSLKCPVDRRHEIGRASCRERV